jgi:hypothetical protein
VEVSWNEGVIPAKILLFWEIADHQFNASFHINNTYVTGTGTYALAYSLHARKDLKKAHGASHMVQFGEIDCDKDKLPKLFIFPVDSIIGPISAVPYQTTGNIVKAIEWIFLRPKQDWYNIFVSLMNETVVGSNNKRKLK